MICHPLNIKEEVKSGLCSSMLDWHHRLWAKWNSPTLPEISSFPRKSRKSVTLSRTATLQRSREKQNLRDSNSRECRRQCQDTHTPEGSVSVHTPLMHDDGRPKKDRAWSFPKKFQWVNELSCISFKNFGTWSKHYHHIVLYHYVILSH